MTPDLVAEFREIERLARDTREGIASGRIPKGSSALRKIEERSSDAARWAEAVEAGEFDEVPVA